MIELTSVLSLFSASPLTQALEPLLDATVVIGTIPVAILLAFSLMGLGKVAKNGRKLFANLEGGRSKQAAGRLQGRISASDNAPMRGLRAITDRIPGGARRRAQRASDYIEQRTKENEALQKDRLRRTGRVGFRGGAAESESLRTTVSGMKLEDVSKLTPDVMREMSSHPDVGVQQAFYDMANRTMANPGAQTTLSPAQLDFLESVLLVPRPTGTPVTYNTSRRRQRRAARRTGVGRWM